MLPRKSKDSKINLNHFVVKYTVFNLKLLFIEVFLARNLT